MPKVWCGGHWHRVEVVARGAPQVLSEVEWKKRAVRHINFESAYFSISLVSANLLTMLYLMEIIPTWEYDTLFSSFVPFILVYALFPFVRGIVALILLRRGRPLPGVYESGVEVSWGKFVPYGEVLGTRRRRTLLGKETLLLELKPGGKSVNLKWLVFQSVECSQVERLVKGFGDERAGPPRLVVYPRGKSDGDEMI